MRGGCPALLQSTGPTTGCTEGATCGVCGTCEGGVCNERVDTPGNSFKEKLCTRGGLPSWHQAAQLAAQQAGGVQRRGPTLAAFPPLWSVTGFACR